MSVQKSADFKKAMEALALACDCEEELGTDVSSFHKGAMWMYNYMEEHKKEDVLARLVPKRINCGGY